MVLESLVNPKNAEKRPWAVFFVGFVYVFFAIILALWIFKQYISLMMVVLVTLASVPLMYRTIVYEEKKDLKIKQERLLIKEHGRALSFFMFLFFGFVVAFALIYVFLPTHLLEKVFSIQTATISNISDQITGNVIGSGLVFSIFLKNLKILFFCLIFSFFYGSGAIYILAWNASVIGAAIGNFIRNSISQLMINSGFVTLGDYFHISSMGLLQYILHGIPEIGAYFMAGLAGGIISVAVIRHDIFHKQFKHIVGDSLDLTVLSILVLFLAALIEVYVTPFLF